MDFTPRTPFQFSVLCLDLITDAVRNALPMQRAMFPKQWTMQVPRELLAAAKQPQRPVAIQMTTVPPPSGWGTSPQRQQGGQEGSPRKSLPEDICHPKIKAMTFRKSSQRQTNDFPICLRCQVTQCRQAARASAGTPFWGGVSRESNAATSEGTCERPT